MKQPTETRVPSDPVIANIVPTRTSPPNIREGKVSIEEATGDGVVAHEAPFSPPGEASPAA